MKKKGLIRLVLLLIFTFFVTATYTHAESATIYVDDMSKLKWQMTNDGNVYFRNLNTFNSEVSGCCYAFVLDTTTAYGKSAWTTILLKIASSSPLFLYATTSNPTDSNPATIRSIGNW